ncbi:MAG: MFS transporter [Pseudomonadota bacterium]
MFHSRPIAFNHMGQSPGHSIARLSGTEGLARAFLVGIIPLVALDALGSKQAVSFVYLLGALLTMTITLNIGLLERLLNRRFVVTLGAAFMALAATFLYFGSGTVFALGIGLRSASASIFSVCISLYIMDYIGKRELTRSESRRMQYQGAAWLIGPSVGLWIYENGNPAFAYLIAGVSSACMLGYFWWLRLGKDQVLRAARSKAPNPFRAVMRYLNQPRLRIAYGITLSRSSFWVAMFVYGPIYVVEANLPVWVAGALLSGVSALLFFSPLVRRLSDRFGTRQIIIGGLILTGMSMVALGVMGEARPAGIVFWVTGAIGGAALDVLGNIPFMRSVKPRERTEMTTVFSTWREGSELLTPALVAGVLFFAPFWVFYFVLAISHFAAAVSASYLPRRL